MYQPALEIPNPLCAEHPHLRLAFEAALLAGGIIQKGYGSVGTVEEKEPGQLVSEVDLEADKQITNYLSSKAGRIPVISEETYQEEEVPDTCWIVDPIDGTAAFVFGTSPEIPAVMIALREDKEDTLSVVLYPLTGEWCYAVKGQGAFDQSGKKLKMRSRTKTLSQALVALNPQHELSKESSAFREFTDALRKAQVCRQIIATMPHSTLALRMLTDESPVSVLLHDNSKETNKQGLWDVAPISLIIREGGGVYWNERGEDYDPLSPTMIIVARDEQIAKELLALRK